MPGDYGAAKEKMVRTQLVPREIHDSRVLRAKRSIPRERFVPPLMKPHAYEDRPLGIGKGRTISQPYIVARMTQALELKGAEKSLEVGTGSGYQAAVLARLCRVVYSEVISWKNLGFILKADGCPPRAGEVLCPLTRQRARS